VQDGWQEDGPGELVRNDGRVGVIRVAGCCGQFRSDEVTGWTQAGHTIGAVGVAVAVLVLVPGLVRVLQVVGIVAIGVVGDMTVRLAALLDRRAGRGRRRRSANGKQKKRAWSDLLLPVDHGWIE
jgi:hypothetical protein